MNEEMMRAQKCAEEVRTAKWQELYKKVKDKYIVETNGICFRVSFYVSYTQKYMPVEDCSFQDKQEAMSCRERLIRKAMQYEGPWEKVKET